MSYGEISIRRVNNPCYFQKHSNLLILVLATTEIGKENIVLYIKGELSEKSLLATK